MRCLLSFLLLHPFDTLPCPLAPPTNILICGYIWIQTEPRLAFPPVPGPDATAVHLIRSLSTGTKVQDAPGSSGIWGSPGPRLQLGDQAAPETTESRGAHIFRGPPAVSMEH